MILVTSLCLVVTSLLHYVLWFLHYVVCSLCDVVPSLCFVDFTSGKKALVPRLYSLLGTGQTGFKRGSSSCSSSRFDYLVNEGNIMKSILKDLKLESLIPKFAAERIEPENVSELFDDELVCLGVTTMGDRHCIRAL